MPQLNEEFFACRALSAIAHNLLTATVVDVRQQDTASEQPWIRTGWARDAMQVLAGTGEEEGWSRESPRVDCASAHKQDAVSRSTPPPRRR
jgi:hypothetical protein